MSAAYQLFTFPKQTGLDSSANLLSGAKAYFYATGTTTPQDTYSDSALTTPNANPVVADSAGVFSAIYLDPTLVYKLTLKTSADVTLYTVDPANENLLTQELIGLTLFPRTAAEISAGVTPVNYAYQAGDLRRYGTNTTPGTTNMLAAFTTALEVIKQAGGGVVTLQGESYNFGDIDSASDVLVDVTSLTNITIEGNGAEIITNTTVTSSTNVPVVLRFLNPNRLTIRNLSFSDTGSDITADVKGPRAIQIACAAFGPDCGDVIIENCVAQDMINLLDTIQAVTPTGRLRGITLINCRATDCYYGISCREDGDRLTAINFVAENIRRAYYVYGVTGHNVDLNISHDGISGAGSTACIIVARHARDTNGIKVKAVYHGDLQTYGAGAAIISQPSSGNGVIKDVNIDLHLSDATLYSTMFPVRIYSLDTDNNLQSTTNDQFDKITIRGEFGDWDRTVTTNPINIESLQSTIGRLCLEPALFDAFMRPRQHYPGFAVQTTANCQIYTKTGDLTAAVMNIPVGDYDGGAHIPLIIKIWAEQDNDLSSSVNSTYRQFMVQATMTGGAITIQQSTSEFLHVVGTSAAPVVGQSGSNLTVTFLNYSSADAYARVEVHHLSKFL